MVRSTMSVAYLSNEYESIQFSPTKASTLVVVNMVVYMVRVFKFVLLA